MIEWNHHFLTYPRHLKRQRLLLDGLWDFCFTPTPDDPVGFVSRMAVPGCWDASVEFALQRGVGHYRQTVAVPASGAYRICFEGVANGAVVEVDGKRVGNHFGPHVPFATPDFHLDEGSHEIVIHVDNRFGEHNAILLKRCGWYCYGGIHRSLCLEKVPEVRVDRLHVTTLSVDETAATVAIQASFSAKAGEAMIHVTSVGGETLWQERVPFANGRMRKTVELGGVVPWSPETPALYVVRVETDDDDLCHRVGFRTIACSNGRILLNGREIKLHGINHHDYHPESGYTSDLLRMKRDLDIIRELGLNFVRTSHYPKDSLFLDLCDEMGLLVWEETPGWQNGPAEMRTERFRQQYLQSVSDMVIAHYNHPCIILWGFLNEVRSEYQDLRPVFEAITGRFRELDPHRPVTYATNRLLHNPDKMLDLVDVLAPNLYNGWYLEEYGKEYPTSPAGYLERLLKWFDEQGLGEKPVVIGEVGAGGVAGTHRLDRRRWSEEHQLDIFEEALDAYDDNPRVTGYALWLFADTACCESEEMKRPNSHNSKGLLDEYRNPKMAYHAIRARLRSRRPS